MSGGLLRLGPSTAGAGIGREARDLEWLMGRGAPVPATWVMPESPVEPTAAEVALAHLDASRRYAVWPSPAAADDQPPGGERAAPLFVSGSGVAAAVARARSTTSPTPPPRVPPRPLRPVIIQELQPATAAGVAFSRNPMTGLDEVVVEAVAGSRDRLAAEGATAARWVHRWGAFVAAPEDSPLAEEKAAAVVEQTRRFAREYGHPLALEWQWDGAQLWWVRIYPLTGLDRVTVYSNRISREVMPGIIKPLVWSVNVPMVNGAWLRLIGEMIGPNDLRPEDLARAFAYRSYFNMTAIGAVFRMLGMPADTLELLLGLEGGEARPRIKPTRSTLRKVPRMVILAARKLGFSATLRRELPRLRADFRRFPADDLSGRSDEQLLADVSSLTALGRRAAYLNIVTPLLANLYTGMLRRRLASAGVDFAAFDLTDGLAGLDSCQPGPHLDRLGRLLAALDEPTRERVAAGGLPALPDALRAQFDRFLTDFGHLSDSGNDFSSAPWREQPDLLVAMALAAKARGLQPARVTWEEARSRFGPFRRPAVRLLYGRARNFVLHREAVSSAYTFGYGLFRPLLLEVGRRLCARGVLAEPGDVMYLYLPEVTDALLGRSGALPPASLVAERRAEIESLRDAVMPELIFGDDFTPAAAATGQTRRLAGTPTSRGHHTGPARVIREIAEFERLRPGDVLVIPYSDVSWTPLFPRAGAVVAESGGMLSHSSITAREYGLPCVVSVSGAMQVPDGAMLTVDGYTGEVLVSPGGGAGGR